MCVCIKLYFSGNILYRLRVLVFHVIIIKKTERNNQDFADENINFSGIFRKIRQYLGSMKVNKNSWCFRTHSVIKNKAFI